MRETTKQNRVRSYAAVGLPKSAHWDRNGASPWLWCDPRLQGECSAAVRAFRLVCFAVAALILAPLRSRAHAETLRADDAAAITLLKLGRQHDSDQASRIRAPKKARPAIPGQPSAVRIRTVIAGRMQRAADDSMPPMAWLRVRRSHGPPARLLSPELTTFSLPLTSFVSSLPTSPSAAPCGIPDRQPCRIPPTLSALTSIPAQLYLRIGAPVSLPVSPESLPPNPLITFIQRRPPPCLLLTLANSY
jgi:hypothetical protein